MAFLTLEDMKGLVEVILFPDVFQSALSYLRGGDPIWIRGTLDQSEEHVKIKGIEVHPLQEASGSAARPLRLKVPLSALSHSRLEDLKNIFADHKGTAKVFLHVVEGETQETVIALSDRFAVDPSQQFQKHVEHLFQPSSISFE
jgi:DNA polymerase-3 subunit alpha